MANPRVRKIADRIQVIVAEMLERRIKDPRLGFVTVTDVRVTGDSQQATIFYTVLGEDTELANTAAALESAKGLLPGLEHARPADGALPEGLGARRRARWHPMLPRSTASGGRAPISPVRHRP